MRSTAVREVLVYCRDARCHRRRSELKGIGSGKDQKCAMAVKMMNFSIPKLCPSMCWSSATEVRRNLTNLLHAARSSFST